MMPSQISDLARVNDARGVLQDVHPECHVVGVDDEPHDCAGVEQPEVVVRQAKPNGVRAPHVADVLARGDVSQAGGEKEPLPLGRRVVDQADALNAHAFATGRCMSLGVATAARWMRSALACSRASISGHDG